MSVQVYAPLSGYYSFATVGRALIRELVKHGIEVSAFDFDPAEFYTDLPAEVERTIRPGTSAIALGPPGEAARLIRSIHHPRRLGLMVWEADALPSETQRALEAFDIVAVPSAWCLRALGSGLGRPRPPYGIWLVPHGLDDAFHPIAQAAPAAPAPFVLGHWCTAVSSCSRKGTPELIAAFADVFGRQEDVRLDIVVPLGQELAGLDQLALPPRVRIRGERSHSPAAMAIEYRKYDAIVQPSRAEGFGLIPLEARACGIPTAYTSGTGHAEHFPWVEDQGVVYVPSREFYQHPLETGRWLDLDRDGVGQALRELYRDRVLLRSDALAAAPELHRRWSWPQALGRVIEWARRG